MTIVGGGFEFRLLVEHGRIAGRGITDDIKPIPHFHGIGVAKHQGGRILDLDLHDRHVLAFADRRAVGLDLEGITAAALQEDEVDPLERGELGFGGELRHRALNSGLGDGLAEGGEHLHGQSLKQETLPVFVAFLHIGNDVGVREDVARGMDQEAGARTDVLDVEGPLFPHELAAVAGVDPNHRGLREHVHAVRLVGRTPLGGGVGDEEGRESEERGEGRAADRWLHVRSLINDGGGMEGA